MSTEPLSAWAGHLLIVGGRPVRIPPPGALAELANKRAPRAREHDTFAVLIAPAPNVHASSDFFASLAQLASDTYFASGGGVTGGLREALTAVNDRVLAQAEQMERAPLVQAAALVMRGSDVYAARSGQMFLAWWNRSALTFLPADRSDSLSVNLPPLGGSADPDIQLAHYTIAPGDVILLADPGLSEISDATLQEALSQPDLRGILEQLKTLGVKDMSASVVQFAAPGEGMASEYALAASPRDPREARSESPGPVRMAARPSSRPAIHSARPAIPRIPLSTPEAPIPEEPSAPGQPAAGPAQPFMPESLPELNEKPPDTAVSPDAVARNAATHEVIAQASAVDHADTASPAPAPLEFPEPEPGPHMGDRLRSLFQTFTPGIERGEDPAVVTLSAPYKDEPGSITRTVRQGARRVQRGVLGTLLRVVNGLSSAFGQVLPAPDEEGKQGIPTNIAVGMAILIPVVIVVAVVGLALTRQGETKFEVYRDRAKAAHATALGLSGGSCENKVLRDKWVEVLQLARQAEQLRPNDLEVLSIRADAQNYLDCYDSVERRDLTLLHEFPRNASLVGPILSESRVDLYTLDKANSLIYHDTLNPEGNQLTTRDNVPVIFKGQAVGAYVVGDILDIEWMASGGTRHDNVLIALDRNGVLIAYSLTFFQSAQQLVTEERWVNPIAIAVFGQNLYVLDTGADQIWRYSPPPGERQYSRAPEEYFNGPAQPDLAEAVDFGIDRNGAVHILFRDGSIRKFRSNTQSVVEEQPFSYQRQPSGAFSNGVVLFVDNDQASSSLQIVDDEHDTIYETSWAGRYNTGYRPRNLPDAFESITGVYADTVVRNNMYVLANNKLYHFYRNEP